MKQNLFIGVACALGVVACSSKPAAPEGAALPEWARQPTRIVDNGYIVYVESDEDAVKDRARMKAEGLALQDIANECTFVPKGARIEDRFDVKTGPVHQSYAKIGLEMQTCEEAKKAGSPEAIRKLADAPMTEEIARYREATAQAVAQPDEPSAPTEASREAGPMPTAAPGSAPVAPSTREYFVAREQIVYVKQSIILAPPTAYPAGAPQTVAPRSGAGAAVANGFAVRSDASRGAKSSAAVVASASRVRAPGFSRESSARGAPGGARARPTKIRGRRRTAPAASIAFRRALCSRSRKCRAKGQVWRECARFPASTKFVYADRSGAID